VEARLGEPVVLHAVLVVGRGARARYYTDAAALVLGGHKIPRRQLAPWSALPAAQIDWALVEPRPFHQEREPPNPGNPAYSNSVLFGPRHGKWLGFDTLEYHETPVPGAGVPSLTVTRATPTEKRLDVNGGLGTMRYRVSVRVPPSPAGAPASAALAAGFTGASPGADSVGPRGILPAVMRVSFRSADADDLVARLTGYFNVPNVFGSGGPGSDAHQAELYQGADCADVIVGAARRAGAQIPYSSVTGLYQHATAVTPVLYMDAAGVRTAEGEAGVPARLRFGQDVRRGDLMLIDYRGFEASPRAWDHVAVVVEDAGEAGVFDPQDLVMHMSYLYGLTREPAATQAPALVQFLRWKPALARTLAGRPR
jgi:cell wall-associated NlpC family hydrolase